MEEKSPKKQTKRNTAAKKPAAVSPFAETVDADSAPAKRVRKKPAAKLAPAPKARKAPVRKAKKTVELALDPFAEIATVTSTAKPERQKRSTRKAAAPRSVKSKPSLDVTAEIAVTNPEVELSPAFKALADVSLPPLEKADRARLLLQSPTRAYFYWSLRENPWAQLRKAFGEAVGSYLLVIKLTDLTAGIDSYYPAEAEGEWWFDVEPGTRYAAEIGFYAPNRPYFRVVYSNTVETPRRSPSSHPASDATWTVSATKFAEVLDVSGFSRDAFDVAMAGDDVFAAADATNLAFSTFVGGGDHSHFAAEDIRYAMLSIAAGVEIEELQGRVSSRLFAALQSGGSDITPERSRAALKEYFDIDDAEWTEEQFAPVVYGASLVHFPKTLQTRKVTSSYSPLSSHSIR